MKRIGVFFYFLLYTAMSLGMYKSFTSKLTNRFKAASIALGLTYSGSIIINGHDYGSYPKSIKGSGIVTEKKIELPNSIKTIQTSGCSTLYVTPGSTTSLIIKAEDNLQQCLQPKVIDKTGLQLGCGDCNMQATQEIIYYLTLQKPIEEISASGATTVDVDLVTHAYPKFNVSGSSNIHIKKLMGQALTAHIAGTSGIAIDSGNTDSQSINCAGASWYTAPHFTSNTTAVKFSGASKGSINFNNGIKGRLSGASSLKLYGLHKNIELSTSGSSSYRFVQKQ